MRPMRGSFTWDSRIFDATPDGLSTEFGPPFLKPKHLAFLKRTVRIFFPNAKPFVFGSRARGDHWPASDLDLLLEDPSLDAGTLLRFHDYMMESDFPFRIDLRAKHLVSPAFLSAIEPESIPLD